jgi:hypothetical protein
MNKDIIILIEAKDMDTMKNVLDILPDNFKINEYSIYLHPPFTIDIAYNQEDVVIREGNIKEILYQYRTIWNDDYIPVVFNLR